MKEAPSGVFFYTENLMKEQSPDYKITVGERAFVT